MNIIQNTIKHVVFSGSAEDLEYLRSEFNRQHYVCLPQFFDSSLLKLILHQINAARFVETIDEGIANESTLSDDITWGMLNNLMNRTAMFRIIEKITDCDRIGNFLGRVHRSSPGVHHNSWHDDLVFNRMAAISINLTTKPYCGGVFQIQDRQSGQVFCQVANTGLGDGILFRIASNLQHRVTSVGGTISRTTFTGFFSSKPNYLKLLKNASAKNGMNETV